jgi:hypothetical protein
MTYPSTEFFAKQGVHWNNWGPFLYWSDQPYVEAIQLPAPTPAEEVTLEAVSRPQYVPSPGKNFPEFKPQAPFVIPAQSVAVDTPNKRFEQDHKPVPPDGTKFGVIVGMERG